MSTRYGHDLECSPVKGNTKASAILEEAKRLKVAFPWLAMEHEPLASPRTDPGRHVVLPREGRQSNHIMLAVFLPVVSGAPSDLRLVQLLNAHQPDAPARERRPSLARR